MLAFYIMGMYVIHLTYVSLAESKSQITIMLTYYKRNNIYVPYSETLKHISILELI